MKAPLKVVEEEGGRGLAPISDRRRRWSLALMTMAVVLSFLDRQIVNILAEPIRKDLGLADWQIGVLSGFVFAIFYTTFGIPIARLAERGNRPWIIAAALACWSAFTAVCGLAGSFVQLLAARIGVGIGEAGCTPPAHSLIADYYPIEKRASALAIYNLGVPIGTLLGLGVGGVLADLVGWRTTFVLVGAPGVLLAAVVVLALKEPRGAVRLTGAGQGGTSLKEALGFLLKKRSFVAIFFFRVHGPELASYSGALGLKPSGFIGLTLGAVFGLSGILGTWLGGHLADRWAPRGKGAYCDIPAWAVLDAIELVRPASQ